MSVQPIHLFFITSSFGIMRRKAFIPHIKITSWILISIFSCLLFIYKFQILNTYFEFILIKLWI